MIDKFGNAFYLIIYLAHFIIVSSYAYQLVFDTKKSDGQFKKTADNSLLKKHFNNFKFKPLKEGLKETITWFKINYNTIRK